MPRLDGIPSGASAEDRLALLMQRIEKKRHEEQAKPPPKADGAPQGPGGANGTPESGSGGTPQRDAVDPPRSSREATPNAPRVDANADRPSPNPETEQRKLSTHLAEGQPTAPSPKPTVETPPPAESAANELPTYGQLYGREQQRFEADKRTQRAAAFDDLLKRQSETRPAALAKPVDCRDCHPDPVTAPPSFNTFGRMFGQPPAQIDHNKIRSELDTSFDKAADGLDPMQRGRLAQDQSNRLATDDLPQARSYERDFRKKEAARLETAAKADGVSPSDRERMLALSHEVMRRPMSGGTQEFVSQLEKTPSDQLSHRDAKAALSTIRAHKPADASAYDPVTGVKPGNEDMFYSRSDEAALFNADTWTNRDPQKPFGDRRALLGGGEKCYDCHPKKKNDSFDLSSFRPFDRPALPSREDRITKAVDNKMAVQHPDVAKGSESYDALSKKYRDENALRERLMLAGNDPAQRLKIPRDQLDTEQQRVLDDHITNHRLNNLEKKVRPRFQKLDAEYVKNGWGEDSPFYGVDREAFLKDVADKPIERVSSYDRFRALDGIDSFKQDNPEIFDNDPNSFSSFRDRVEAHEEAQRPKFDFNPRTLIGGEKCYDCHPKKKNESFDLSGFGGFDTKKKTEWPTTPAAIAPPPTSPLYYRDEAEMRSAGLKGDDISSRLAAAKEDPNNPIPYLKRPMSELSEAEHKQVSEDYTRNSVEKIEREFRTSLVDTVGNEVDKLDRTFDRILEDQGIIGDFADAVKNNIGTKDGWLIDSQLGSNAVAKTIGDAYAAKRSVQDLKNFEGTHDEFVKAYQSRVQNLQQKIDEVPKHIDKFNQSQANWVEGVSDIASVSAAIGAAALAPVTGGASLAVGAAVGALTKVGTKGLEAVTGSGEYQGNVGLDLLKGGLNGASGVGTNLLAQTAAKKMLATAASRAVAGESVSMLTRAGIWGTTAVGEGAIDGYVVGTGSSLIDGKSLSESNMNGLRGAAFGAILNPVGQGAFAGIRRLWKGKAPVDAPVTSKVGDVDTPDNVKLKASSIADEVGKQLDDATTSIGKSLEDWPHANKQGLRQKQRAEKIHEELQLAKKLHANNPTEATSQAAQELLANTERMRKAITDYAELAPPQLSPGKKSPAEIEAHNRARTEFQTQEKALRQEVVDAYASSQQAMYESLRKTAGITVEPLDPTKRGAFGRDPIAEIEKVKLGPDETPNRAYAELETNGTKRPIGPARSGGGEAEGVHGNPYEAESRPLESVTGQHNKSRANDSEVRLLGLANKALDELGDQPGKLRIFTELPPCASCQRVMAKFRADHPNIEIQVYHRPQ